MQERTAIAEKKAFCAAFIWSCLAKKLRNFCNAPQPYDFYYVNNMNGKLTRYNNHMFVREAHWPRSFYFLSR